MTGIEKARQLFKEAGLAFPAIPGEYESRHYLVRDPLEMFIHLSYGVVYLDAEKNAAITGGRTC